MKEILKSGLAKKEKITFLKINGEKNGMRKGIVIKTT